MQRPRMTLIEAIAGIFDHAGKTVIDVGCGDGTLVRHFAAARAHAIGVEVSEGQLARALAQAGPGETYRVASGESLPFPDASALAILYMKSFHHVPMPAMRPALAEAARVLEPGGFLVIVEPLPEGSFFELTRLVEDETEVRAAAYAALKSPPPGLTEVREFFYDSLVRMGSAEAVLERLDAVDPARRERVAQAASELRRRFAELQQEDSEGPYFVAPMRGNVLVKAG